MTDSSFIVLEARIQEELDNIHELRQSLEVRGFLTGDPELVSRLSDEWEARGVGSTLHDLYSAVEKVFRIIARDVDQNVPSSAEWHRELLNQMSLSLPGIRPAVITKNLHNSLGEFLSFRHVFRNIYGFNLSPEKLASLLGRVPRVCQSFEEEITDFLEVMRKCLETLE